ncbi:unnamed protein product, partial [Symbiodinium necroappetens]
SAGIIGRLVASAVLVAALAAGACNWRDDFFSGAVAHRFGKINKANWALFLLGLSTKNTSRTEDGEGLKSVLKTIMDWYAARDIDPNFSLQEMHWDDTDAGRLAMAAIFPQIASKICIRHQLQAVRRRTGDLKKFVASMVSFTSHTVNPFLLDLLWQSVLQRLAFVDVDWEAYLSRPVDCGAQRHQFLDAEVVQKPLDQLPFKEGNQPLSDRLGSGNLIRPCEVEQKVKIHHSTDRQGRAAGSAAWTPWGRSRLANKLLCSVHDVRQPHGRLPLRDGQLLRRDVPAAGSASQNGPRVTTGVCRGVFVRGTL